VIGDSAFVPFSCQFDGLVELSEVVTAEFVASADRLRVDLHRERRVGVADLLADVDDVVTGAEPQRGVQAT
jgi:hypothetical protein